MGCVHLVSLSEIRSLYLGTRYHPNRQFGYVCTRSLHEEHWLVSDKDQKELQRMSYESNFEWRIWIGTYYTNDKDSNGCDIKGLERDLIRIILKQMNMTFVHVPKADGFELEEGSVNNLISAVTAKEAYTALGGVTNNFLCYTSFDLTNSHFTTRFRWYVPCPVNYPRWSNIFRILFVNLLIVVIISIVFAAILTKIFGNTAARRSGKGSRH